MADIKLQIGADPFFWVLKDSGYQTLAGHLGQAAGPVVLPVQSPLNGLLILSPAAGSVSLTRPEGVGWKPSDATLPEFPVLYVPSATAPTVDNPGYILAPGTDLATLENNIKAAMSDPSKPLTVEVHQGSFVGVLVLHGATLPYAVLCPSAPVA